MIVLGLRTSDKSAGIGFLARPALSSPPCPLTTKWDILIKRNICRIINFMQYRG